MNGQNNGSIRLLHDRFQIAADSGSKDMFRTNALQDNTIATGDIHASETKHNEMFTECAPTLCKAACFVAALLDDRRPILLLMYWAFSSCYLLAVWLKCFFLYCGSSSIMPWLHSP